MHYQQRLKWASCYLPNCCCVKAYQISAGNLTSFYWPDRCHKHTHTRTHAGIPAKHICQSTPPALSSPFQPFSLWLIRAKILLLCWLCSAPVSERKDGVLFCCPEKASGSDTGTSDREYSAGMGWPHTLSQMYSISASKCSHSTPWDPGYRGFVCTGEEWNAKTGEKMRPGWVCVNVCDLLHLSLWEPIRV